MLYLLSPAKSLDYETAVPAPIRRKATDPLYPERAAELIALLLRTGLPGLSVLQLAQQLLDTFDGLGGLLQASASDLKRIKGLGPAKRAEITAVMELARRSLAQELAERAVLTSPQQVKDFLRLKLAHLGHEVFAVLFLDSQHRLIVLEEMFRGTLSQTSVYPREVVLRALHHHAAAVVLTHNHPSGTVTPSRADESLTQTLKAALARQMRVCWPTGVVAGMVNALSNEPVEPLRTVPSTIGSEPLG